MSGLVGIAARGVVRNRRRSAIVGAMLALGVAAVIFASGFIAGLQTMIVRALVDMRFGDFEAARVGFHDAEELVPLELDLGATIVDDLAHIPGVATVSPRIRFVGMISKGDVTQIISGLGVDPRCEATVCPMGPASHRSEVGPAGDPYLLVAGEGLGAPDGVVLGPALAEALGAEVGETITIIARTRGGSMDGVDARVVGIYKWDNPEDNRRSIVIPLALAQQLVHMRDRVTSVAVRVDPGAEVQTVLGRASQVLASHDAEARTWHRLGPYLRDVMTLQDRVIAIVMLIVFVLLAAGGMTTMMMAVQERTREIGTLMALGMRTRRVLALFVLESVLLGIAAAAVGLALGMGLIAWANHAGIPFTIPAVGSILTRPELDVTTTAYAVAAAIASSLVAAVIPARRAARTCPVEALRAA